MLNSLKFDLYKIVKSRGILCFVIASLLLCFVNPIFDFNSRGNVSVWFLLTQANMSQLLVALFAVLLGTKDFNSNFIYNIYNKQNKVSYVISKFICIVLYTFVIFGFTFFLYFMFDKIFGIGEFYSEAYSDYGNYELKSLTYIFISRIIGTITFGFVLLFFSFLVKNTAIMLVLTTVYMFFSSYLYRLLNLIADKLFLLKIDFERYTPFGATNLLTMGTRDKDFITIIIVCSIYFVLSLVLSILFFYKKKF